MGRVYEVLDGPRARKNGICQMVVGSLCIVFNIAIFVILALNDDWFWGEQITGAGIWGGVFYTVSGSLIFVASSRRSFCYIVSALVLNVVSLTLSLPHVALMSISIMSDERRELDGSSHWEYPTYVSLFR